MSYRIKIEILETKKPSKWTKRFFAISGILCLIILIFQYLALADYFGSKPYNNEFDYFISLIAWPIMDLFIVWMAILLYCIFSSRIYRISEEEGNTE